MQELLDSEEDGDVRDNETQYCNLWKQVVEMEAANYLMLSTQTARSSRLMCVELFRLIWIWAQFLKPRPLRRSNSDGTVQQSPVQTRASSGARSDHLRKMLWTGGPTDASARANETWSLRFIWVSRRQIFIRQYLKMNHFINRCLKMNPGQTP